eukprot:jgi/Undpi1/2365/HiC_scaffold_13.g05748.m1
MAGPDGKWRNAEGGVSPFVDTSKSVRLTGAPQPGSVSQAVFVGEACDRKCAEWVLDSRTTFTDQHSGKKRSNARNDGCQLPDSVGNEPEQSGGRVTQRGQEKEYSKAPQGRHGHEQLPDHESRAENKVQSHGQLPDVGREHSGKKRSNARNDGCQLPDSVGNEPEQSGGRVTQRCQEKVGARLARVLKSTAGAAWSRTVAGS